MAKPQKKYSRPQLFVLVLLTASLTVARNGQAAAHDAATLATPQKAEASPPPSSVGIFPLSGIHRGLHGTAWTVFEGTVPEPMEVEILGVLHGYLGPGKDLILARLRGTKPEYTGVVAGMSGSPVYIDGKLAGALSYRIGQFSKEPIAGITPIEQMLEVRDLPLGSGSRAGSAAIPLLVGGTRSTGAGADLGNSKEMGGGLAFSAMDTPLLMSGFQPEAIRVWRDQVAGTGLDMVSAGGAMGSSAQGGTRRDTRGETVAGGESVDFGLMEPGSAVSLQLVRGDLEIAATCTVTYIDPKQLLACGHPVLQAGPVSLPMTSAEVVATVPSPLNAFKIVNTGRTIGAFTDDRESGIRGELGAKARMIPISIRIAGPGAADLVERKVEVVDLPSLTASAVLVSVYQTLLETNQSTAKTSYHVTGEIRIAGQGPVPVDAWGTPGEQMGAQLGAAFAVADSFNRLYLNAGRLGQVEGVELRIETIPQDLRTELEGVRLITTSIVHAGDTVVVEATLRTWKQEERNVRIPFTVPARLEPGTLRVLVGGAGALDRTLDAASQATHAASEAAVSARLRGLHAADQLYVSLLLPESQASLEGETLDSLPLSMANTLESQRTGMDVGLHGESVVVAAQAPAGGVLNGQQVVSLYVEAGGGLH